MLYIIIPLSIITVVILAILLISLGCFFKIFYSRKRKPLKNGEYSLPEGAIYEVYHVQMMEWIDQSRTLPHTKVSIRSFDGLTLRGKYYEYKEGAPIELLFHGYRGNSERDLCGAVYRCFALGHNALIVDHRASGESDGRVISFGINESRDCIFWIDFIIKNIDAEAKIIITGISMGAATVMTAAGKELPKNVVGVLADCGYTSTKDIIKKVMKDMHLPPNIVYPFARLGAILFGGFDPEAASPIESMKNCTLPIIFFHGDSDDYVPSYMSEQNFNTCISGQKRLVITKDAGHGLCFPKDMDTYFCEVRDFFSFIY